MTMERDLVRPPVAREPVRPARQRGVVLFAALIALVAMTLASLALMRSIDTGLVIAGNTAFKEATTSAADIAMDAATQWLQATSRPSSNLYASQAANGYYANWLTGCDITANKTPGNTGDDLPWTSGASTCLVTPKAVAAGMPPGYAASYVIARMCTCDGRPGANAICAASADNICVGMAVTERFHGTVDYAYRGMQSTEQGSVSTGNPYYRVIARVVGPRNTTSFVETIVTLE